MNITVDHQEDCIISLRAELTADEVSSERKKVTASFAGQAKVPGFRPGKVPAKVIEKRYGPAIQDEVRDRLVRRALDEGIQKEKLEVLGVREVNEDTFHTDGTFSFVASITGAPQIKLPDYKGLKLEIPKKNIGEEQVNQSLDNLRERFSEFNDIEGRKLKMEDLAVITYTGKIDGELLSEARPDLGAQLSGSEDFWVKMDEESFLPGFCNDLVDMEIGGKKDVTVVLPEDFPVEDLQQKELVYAVELKGIKEQVLPELNDEFASKLEEGKTLEDIKEQIVEQLETEWDRQVEVMKTNQIVSHLDESTEFDIPSDLIGNETQRRVNEMAVDAQKRGMPEDQIMSHQDEIVESASQQARLNVKTAFILDEIAKVESIVPTDEELTQAVVGMAGQSGVPLKKYLKELKKENGISRIKQSLTTDKTLAYLRDEAEIVEVDAPEEEAA